jgi:poly(3-hydroxybutyrate) depolymerase
MKTQTFILLLTAVLVLGGCADYVEPDFQYITSYDVVGGWHAASSLDSALDGMSDFDDKAGQNATKYSVQLFKVRYRTTYQGAPVTASGVVLVPTSSGGAALPVVSYHHGTKFYDGEIPSMSTAFNLEKEVGWAYVMASAGFVCSVPDYLGFNESYHILHPYLLEEPTGTVAIDMLRATFELCEYINVKTTNRIFLTGYSEGGYTTMVVQKRIQEKHTGEFNLVASSAGPDPTTC